MLQIFCSETELQEYGEVLTVGDRIERMAARREPDGSTAGSEVDRLDWSFNRYAAEIGYESATITGRVTALSAVYTRLTADGDGGWGPRPGSTTLETVPTTVATRLPRDPLADVVPPTPLLPEGLTGDVTVAVDAAALLRDGDESFSGWIVTLEDERVQPLPPRTAERP